MGIGVVIKMVSLQRENAKAATETAAAAATLSPPATWSSCLHTHKHGKWYMYTTSHVKT